MSEVLVRVGRWMRRRQYDLMLSAGCVQESVSGTTHIASPADPSSHRAQAALGSLYIEFDVPQVSVKPTQQGWAKILGPNTLGARLAERKGQPPPQMPPAVNITLITTKSEP